MTDLSHVRDSRRLHQANADAEQSAGGKHLLDAGGQAEHRPG